MQLDKCLILSAGFGTRMGDVTNSIPKALIPVFNKTIIELQIEYVQKLGVKKIYINTHHLSAFLQRYLKRKKFEAEVHVIHEEEILDIGGGIHNIAQMENYSGNMLVISGDQFLFFDIKSALKKMLEDVKTYPVSLLGIEVLSSKGYSGIDIQDGLLKGIIPNKDQTEEKVYTYSGMSIVNLEKLKPREGKSNFFGSVANYKENEISVYEVSDYEYWDFGTSERYFDSMEKALKSRTSSFHQFFKGVGGIIFEPSFEFDYVEKRLKVSVKDRSFNPLEKSS